MMMMTTTTKATTIRPSQLEWKKDAVERAVEKKRATKKLENVITLRICQLWEITRKHVHSYIHKVTHTHTHMRACTHKHVCIAYKKRESITYQLAWEGLIIYTKYRRLEGFYFSLPSYLSTFVCVFKRWMCHQNCEMLKIKILSSGKVDAIIHVSVSAKSAINKLLEANTEGNIDRVNK